MLRANLVQRVYAFIAPKLVAGADAKSPIEGSGISRMKDAVRLEDLEVIRFGEDVCMTGRLTGKSASYRSFGLQVSEKQNLCRREEKCLPES